MTRRDFASGFLKWNEDLSLRKLQWVVWNHIYGLHKTDISIFLKICSVLQQYAFKLHQIYNSIETGLTWVYKPVCKVCTARVHEDCTYNDLCFLCEGWFFVFIFVIILKMIFLSGNRAKISWKVQTISLDFLT